MNPLEIEALVAQLLQAKKAYYHKGISPLSDTEFDALEEQLRAHAPQHTYFGKVGYASRGVKVEHRLPMLSADKCKTLPELQKWLDRLALPEGTELIIEPKIDGLSATCVYEKGQLVYVATRGDGKIGQDITHITQYMKSIPIVLEQPLDLEVRGELYLPQATDFDTQGRPLRNNCVGLINRKEDQEDLKYVHFTAYQVFGSNLQTEYESISALKTLGFDIVPLKKLSEFDEVENYYHEYLDVLRYQWPYETDGLIIMVDNRRLHDEIDARWVVDHHHHYLVAFKPPAQACQTQLEAIQWQVSRQGHLIPVAIFQAITLGGATLTRASLHNAETIKNMRIMLGDTLLVERANDVIPYVRANLSHHEEREFDEGFLPSQCPSCAMPVAWQAVHLNCSNPHCVERMIQRVLYWVSCCDMENIAEATIRLLFEKKLIQGIVDLYKITTAQLFSLEGFAEKKVNNFIQEIHKSRQINAQELIGRLGIPLVQRKALKKLGIFSMQDFWDFESPNYVIGRNLIAWRDDTENKAMLEELLDVLDVEDLDKEAHSGQPQVCCTGTGPHSRQELTKILASMNYMSVSQVTKETQLLLCDDVNGTSSKLVKARKLGIPIQTYQEFFAQKGQLF